MKKIDMTLTPSAMLLDLINTANNASYTPDTIAVSAPSVVADATEVEVTVDGVVSNITRNTSVSVMLSTSEIPGDSVVLKYQRIDLANLFSLATPTLRETDLEDAGTVTVPKIISEILRKYSIATTADDFSYTVTQNTIVLTALPTNHSYLGNVTVTIEQSLASRIAVTTLDGFTKPVPEVAVVDISPRISNVGKLTK